MSNPTTPFSWQMPTATDLVTDLPADFEVFGQAVATSMADLLGGTTGQVLSKTSNADMDFTWVTSDDANAIQNDIVDAKGDIIAATAADTPARLAVGTAGQILSVDSSTSTGLKWITPNPGDITGVTATSPLTGGGTSGDVTVGIQASSTTQSGAVQLTDSTSSTSTTTAATPNSVKTSYDLANAAIPKSLVDAKGDILTATADNTPARLAVGTNGQTLVADSTASTGLKWATASSGGPTLTDYTPTFTNFTLGNGTAITKWYDASATMFYIYINITYGSTSTQSGALRVSTPATTAGDADGAVAGQMILGKFCDVSAGKDYQCYAAAGTNTSLQLFSYDVTTSPARNGNVNDTTPVVPATGDEFFIQGWLRKA